MPNLDSATFLTAANAGFITELYARFLENPDAVDQSWRSVFSDIGDDLSAVLTDMRRPAWPKPTDGAASAARADGEASIRPRPTRSTP